MVEGMDGGWMDERENESFFSSGRGQTRLTRKVVLPSGTRVLFHHVTDTVAGRV